MPSNPQSLDSEHMLRLSLQQSTATISSIVVYLPCMVEEPHNEQ